MTPEQFKWWKKGMEDAAAICQAEVDAKNYSYNYAVFIAEKGIAALLKNRISSKVTSEEFWDNRNKVHPTHKMIGSHVGEYCKKCGCEGNLSQPCDGDGEVNYEQ